MNHFNIRVYGILRNSKGEILLSSERRNGNEFTKFPGGGLEFGEGIKDCLKREFMEELEIEIEPGELFYLTDFFQQSAFHKDHQLISVYYHAHFTNCDAIKCSELVSGTQDKETFHWVKPEDLNEEMLTFPVDKVVAGKLREMLNFEY